MWSMEILGSECIVSAKAPRQERIVSSGSYGNVTVTVGRGSDSFRKHWKNLSLGLQVSR